MTAGPAPLSGMLIKVVIVGFLIAIVTSLMFGAYFLVKDPSTSKRTMNALTWRVGLQVALIVLLIVAFLMGWLKPHGAITP
jgi:Na+-translocating ferredoxin:NAD+ oxidoreductase RnfD subunit